MSAHKKPPNEHWLVTPDVICIELSYGMFALVDVVDYPKVANYHWYPKIGCNTYYAITSAHKEGGGQKWLKMHRVILAAADGSLIDHDDGHGLNNSSVFGYKNISIVTRRGNGQNLHIQKTSKYPGVSWDRRRNKWLAQIVTAGKRYNLGRFNEEIDAYKAYLKACSEIEAGTFLAKRKVEYSCQKTASPQT